MITLYVRYPSVFPCQQSCPAIQVYTASNLEYALEAAAKNFISQEVEIQGNQVIILYTVFIHGGKSLQIS